MSIATRAVTVISAGSLVISTSAAANAEVIRPGVPQVYLVATVKVSSLPPTAKYGVACVAAVAGAATATAAGTAQQPTAPGCVMPVLDAPPPTTTASAIPVRTVGAGGLGVLPVLLGVLAIAGAIALLADGDGDDDRDTVSPD